ncbi:MAG: hypothetical protein K8T89_16300 [Planctomycetes bacterium]|nr:hypothetical protein [Planctomycetota bacterium]
MEHFGTRGEEEILSSLVRPIVDVAKCPSLSTKIKILDGGHEFPNEGWFVKRRNQILFGMLLGLGLIFFLNVDFRVNTFPWPPNRTAQIYIFGYEVYYADGPGSEERVTRIWLGMLGSFALISFLAFLLLRRWANENKRSTDD